MGRMSLARGQFFLDFKNLAMELYGSKNHKIFMVDRLGHAE